MDDQPNQQMSKDGLVIRDRRPRNPWAVILTGVLIVGFVVGSFFVLTNGIALAIGLYLTVVTAVITGLMLERIDSSRKAPRHPGEPHSHWGFRGRPGA